MAAKQLVDVPCSCEEKVKFFTRVGNIGDSFLPIWYVTSIRLHNTNCSNGIPLSPEDVETLRSCNGAAGGDVIINRSPGWVPLKGVLQKLPIIVRRGEGGVRPDTHAPEAWAEHIIPLNESPLVRFLPDDWFYLERKKRGLFSPPACMIWEPLKDPRPYLRPLWG